MKSGSCLNTSVIVDPLYYKICALVLFVLVDMIRMEVPPPHTQHSCRTKNKEATK